MCQNERYTRQLAYYFGLISGQKFPAGLYVPLDLFHQLPGARESLLLPVPLEKMNLEKGAVQVLIKIEKVGFHEQGFASRIKGGTGSNRGIPCREVAMDYLSLMLRWLHIGSAIILVGGIVFWRSTLLPALETLSPPDRDKLQTSLRQRWSRWVMLTSGLLLISGLVNAVLNMKQYEFAGNLYHILVTVKLMLALTLFWIASVLSGSSVLAQRWRPKTKFWLNVGHAMIASQQSKYVTDMRKRSIQIASNHIWNTSLWRCPGITWKGGRVRCVSAVMGAARRGFRLACAYATGLRTEDLRALKVTLGSSPKKRL